MTDIRINNSGHTKQTDKKHGNVNSLVPIQNGNLMSIDNGIENARFNFNKDIVLASRVAPCNPYLTNITDVAGNNFITLHRQLAI